MDDSISRQAAINVMCELMHHWFGGDPKDEIREIKRELEKLPSVERKKGGWIKMSDADGTYWCCSECGEELYRPWSFNIFPKKASIDKTNFCPKCGADMRSEE